MTFAQPTQLADAPTFAQPAPAVAPTPAKDGVTPTAEQAAIVDAATTGADLVIEAGAGTGKTSTLKLLAGAKPAERGLYVAYNRAIADDARASFPPNVTCATAHSLAYRVFGKQYRERLNGPRVTGRQAAEILGLKRYIQVGDRVIMPRHLARLVMETIGRFCHSDAPGIEPYHVPAVPGVDHEGRRQVVDYIVPIARKAWREDLTDLDGRLKFTHDMYLKLWQLSGPNLNVDFVLLDEAQDSNPVVADVIDSQRSTQRILVGDRAQSIYGWRGAVDAMQSFTGERFLLSQSFRFGQGIADEANKWLELIDTPLRLRGFERINSTLAGLDNPDAILCRSNAQAVAEAFRALSDGIKPALVGGAADIRRLAEAALALQAGARTDHPELFTFTSWGDVQEHAEEDAAGADLKVFVRLVDRYGADSIIDLCDRLGREENADLVISTAHRAKGREWDRVRIADDFPEPDEGEDVDPAEAMLAYVAVTRARLTLDREGLAWIDGVGRDA